MNLKNLSILKKITLALSVLVLTCIGIVTYGAVKIMDKEATQREIAQISERSQLTANMVIELNRVLRLLQSTVIETDSKRLALLRDIAATKQNYQKFADDHSALVSEKGLAVRQAVDPLIKNFFADIAPIETLLTESRQDAAKSAIAATIEENFIPAIGQLCELNNGNRDRINETLVQSKKSMKEFLVWFILVGVTDTLAGTTFSL